MKILTAPAMQVLDRLAIEQIGIPSAVLMENAAIGVADAISAEFPHARVAAIVCGPGNNGGDGLAVARHLTVRGYVVRVFVVAAGRELQGDAALQLEICRAIGIDPVIVEPDPDGLLAVADAAAAADVLVDALFGTGLSRPLEGVFAELVDRLNQVAVPKIAVDLPSGLNGSTSDTWEPHLVADLTVTFAVPKVAHVLSPAATAVGRLIIADLGFPAALAEQVEGNLHLLVGAELAALRKPRLVAAHKGDFGHALVVGGSEGKSGAAVLAAQAAVRSGAGLVTVAVPAGILPTVEAASLESMSVSLPESDSGGLALGAAAVIAEAAAGKQVLAIGPGLGTEAGTSAVVRQVVLESVLPAVIDADGLNAFAGHLDDLATRRGATVLTPHPGELARLLEVSPVSITDDRLASVQQAAAVSDSVVILKGHQTLIATPEGDVFVNPTGNPGMATGGSGDVLTGLIAGLIAQGLAPLAAAQVGVFTHGLAGDLAAEQTGEAGLAAADLLGRVPLALERLADG